MERSQPTRPRQRQWPRRRILDLPSIGYIGARKASSDPVLHGVGDVDQAFEAGARVSYRWQNARALFELRHGFGGYSGWVGQLGADAIFQPTAKLTIEIGPRLGFADDGYMQTYFGITPEQAAASGYQIYDASTGFKNVGAQGEARYQLSNRWALVGKFEYQHLISDAGDSPLVSAGARDQLTIGLGLATRLQWSSER
ncbi:MAG: MipA/OmpV family protein [Hyphomicrobiaceae bacterium]